jgi:hypothetical protein
MPTRAMAMSSNASGPIRSLARGMRSTLLGTSAASVSPVHGWVLRALESEDVSIALRILHSPCRPGWPHTDENALCLPVTQLDRSICCPMPAYRTDALRERDIAGGEPSRCMLQYRGSAACGYRLRYGYGSLGASLHKANRKAAPAAPTALFWRPAPASRWPRDRRLLNYASRPGSDVLDLPPSCTRRERNGGKTV